MNNDALIIESQLCFPLYAASRQITSKYTPLLQELDLTYTQYIVMMVLWEEKETSVKDLGQKLYLDSGTLTPLLKRLERKRYLIRSRSDTDERVVIVSLTEKGEKLKQSALHIPERMAQCINLSTDEAKTLYQILYKILETENT